MAYTTLAAVVLLGVLACSCKAGPTTLRSDKQRTFQQEELSEHDHFDANGAHDSQYDHEAILGDEADEFNELSEEESKRRLAVIVDKMDKDQDGFVTKEELKDWIKHVSRRYIYEDADSQWGTHDTDGDGGISWDEWFQSTYQAMADRLDEVYDNRRGLKYQDMVDRDKRRFEAADENNDGKLDRDEFAIYLHPEDTAYMREVVIAETLQDMDTNKDGFVDLDEYMNDLWTPEEENQGEPEWLTQERAHFSQHRDKNGDGKLDKEELGEWLLPTGYDYIEAEAGHLMQSVDDNSDYKLDKEEILKHHDTFVGSQATEFGESLYRHDEF